MRRLFAEGMLDSMRATSLILPWRVAVYGAFTLGAPWAHAVQTPESPSSAEVNTVRQIRALASQTPDASYSFRLEGDVWWANPVRGELVLKDDTGAEELEMDLAGQALAAGQRVHLEGNGTITPTGPGFRLGANGPVVDNDGVHGMVEKSGAVFLKAGRNPNMSGQMSTAGNLPLTGCTKYASAIPSGVLISTSLPEVGAALPSAGTAATNPAL